MEVIGEYQINRKDFLGKGAGGKVMRAIHLPTNTPVAAKYIEIYDEEDRRDVKKEITALQKASDHPNVLQLLHYEEVDNVIWIITEVCEGNNLVEFLESHSIDLSAKLHLMNQCASALSHTHNLKPEAIIHRDVKPENILVKYDMKEDVITLADFGVAKMIADQARKTMTRTGTTPYMAPEMIADYPKYDKAIDVFSLGVVFLYLLKADTGTKCEPSEGKMNDYKITDNR